ncbi:unnamed protein product [Ixodes persulcatus]
MPIPPPHGQEAAPQSPSARPKGVLRRPIAGLQIQSRGHFSARAFNNYSSGGRISPRVSGIVGAAPRSSAAAHGTGPRRGRNPPFHQVRAGWVERPIHYAANRGVHSELTPEPGRASTRTRPAAAGAPPSMHHRTRVLHYRPILPVAASPDRPRGSPCTAMGCARHRRSAGAESPTPHGPGLGGFDGDERWVDHARHFEVSEPRTGGV